MISVYNTFDPLKEIVLGDVDMSMMDLRDGPKKEKIEYIFNQTKEDLKIFQALLESYGIKVHRPSTIPFSEIKTPYWSMPGTRIPLSPRDLYLVLGDTIIESAMCEPERFFETFYFRDIMIDKFNDGAKWLAMPMVRHNYDGTNWGGTDDQIPNLDPIMDAPSVMKYGRDLFVNTIGAGNQLGLRWLEKHFGDTYNIHEINNPMISGHMDTQINILRPGLIMTPYDPNLLPPYFKEWDFINVSVDKDRDMSDGQELIDSRIQDGDFANSNLVVNCLSVDQNTVVMFDHYKDQDKVIGELDNRGIRVLFTPMTNSHFFNQGVTCMTLELERHTPEGIIKYQ